MAYIIGKHVKPYFEGRRIRSLTAEDFEGWMSDLADDDVPAGTINLARTCVNVALNQLVNLRRLHWNPFRGREAVPGSSWQAGHRHGR